jgi:hypothetical protein
MGNDIFIFVQLLKFPEQIRKDHAGQNGKKKPKNKNKKTLTKNNRAGTNQRFTQHTQTRAQIGEHKGNWKTLRGHPSFKSESTCFDLVPLGACK